MKRVTYKLLCSLRIHVADNRQLSNLVDSNRHRYMRGKNSIREFTQINNFLDLDYSDGYGSKLKVKIIWTRFHQKREVGKVLEFGITRAWGIVQEITNKFSIFSDGEGPSSLETTSGETDKSENFSLSLYALKSHM